MALRRLLQDFDGPAAAADVRPTVQVAVQDLPGYAEGYAAGLVDAAAEQGALSAALVARIEDFEFTYAEAQRAILNGLAPFIAAMAAQLLPATAEARLCAEIAAALENLAAAQVTGPLTLTLAPADLAPVSARIAETGLRCIADPGLSAGQAMLTGPNAGLTIDLSVVTDRLTEALSLLTDTARKDRASA